MTIISGRLVDCLQADEKLGFTIEMSHGSEYGSITCERLKYMVVNIS